MGARKDEPITVRDWRGLPFCQIDNRLMRVPTMTPHAKLVYVILCGYANLQTSECRPSIKTLSTDSGISRPSVRAGIQVLIAHGVLEVTDRHDELGRDRPHNYVIKDWRETSQTRVNDVDTRVKQVDTRVKQVDGVGSTTFTPRVKQVDTKEIESKEKKKKENEDYSAVAEIQPNDSEYNPELVPLENPNGDPYDFQALIARALEFGDCYPNREEACRHAKAAINSKIKPLELIKVAEYMLEDHFWVGKPLQIATLVKYLGAYRKAIKNGWKPGQNGRENNGHTGRSNSSKVPELPSVDGDNTDYYAYGTALQARQEEYRRKEAELANRV